MSLFWIFILFQLQVAVADDQKRLLLNDPSYYASKISRLEAEVASLRQLISRGNPSQKGGSIFTHWGSTWCDNRTSTLIYSGYAGGGYYVHAGAGSNYICLPKDPIYGNRSKTLVTYANYVYGAEYETNFFGTNSKDKDVPCAVCSTKDPLMLMIPARNMCYNGWTTQYQGFLASSYYKQPAQTDYVCMSDSVEYLSTGAGNTNGALFYPVLGSCGALQCPPYVEGEPLTCVVCSR